MTLHLYFARKFFWTFAAILAIFGGIVYLIEIVENIRNFSAQDVRMGQIVRLTLLIVPEALYRSMPMVAVIASVTLFVTLARSSEIVVARSAGRSALRSLGAPLGIAVMIGLISVGILNPIVAATSRQYEEATTRLLKGTKRTLSVSAEGLWLRQGSADGQTVIRALGAKLDGTRLTGVTFLGIGKDGVPTYRIEAISAELEPGAWFLTGTKEWRLDSAQNPETQAVYRDSLRLPSSLTRDQIRDSFGTPSAIAFWDLPQFIARLDAAGFSALAHRAWFQAQLALPLTLVAMVLIGAIFTLRHTRMGRTGLMVLLAIILGFFLQFARNFLVILAQNGNIPPLVGAWSPPIAVILLSLGLLLHLEDG